MKKEQESTNLMAQKMMRGRVEPSVVPIVVRIVPIVVHVVKQIIEVPQMTYPQERQSTEQR